MSSLAKLLNDHNFEVVGSDTNEYFFTEESLIKRNITIFEFNEKNIKEDYYYIIGNAYDINNVEVKKIFDNNYSYMYYHDFISAFIKKDIIACSGTHGKTTVSSLIVNMLDNKCDYIIGDGTGGGYDNNLLVLEACEYKRHFTKYYPTILIINNIELDHTDYYKNKKDLIKAFQEVANNSKIILINGDDKNAKKIKHKNKITFGFNKKNDIKIKILSETKNGYYIKVSYNENHYLKVPFLGKHMIYNYVVSYMTCIIYGIKPNINKEILLPKRRMETYKYNNCTIIIDYAHHPTEINALYESLNLQYKNKKLNVVFQPHTYKRTIKFKKAFKKALNKYDDVYLMDVFTSKREKENNYQQEKINRYFKKFKKYNNTIIQNIRKSSEIWILLGAGTASDIMHDL